MFDSEPVVTLSGGDWFFAGLWNDWGLPIQHQCQWVRIDPTEFLHHWQSDTARQAIQVEFARARAAGIKSYPTLWYQRDGVVQPVAPSFMLPDEAVNRLAVLRATSEVG